MKNLNDALCTYGVNFPEVMERFINDEELYYDCLLSFIDDPSFDGLRNALQSEEYEAAFDYAHTMKGVAGNLGLVPLIAVISEIVEPLRNHHYENLEQKYDAVHAEQEKLRKLLEDLEDENGC